MTEPHGEKSDQSSADAGMYSAELGRAQRRWGMIFDSHDNGNDRVQEILSGLQLERPTYSSFDVDVIRSAIEGLASEDDRERDLLLV